MNCPVDFMAHSYFAKAAFMLAVDMVDLFFSKFINQYATVSHVMNNTTSLVITALFLKREFRTWPEFILYLRGKNNVYNYEFPGVRTFDAARVLLQGRPTLRI
jgi:hypothetical protein